MTEQDWMTCTDPWSMSAFLNDKASPRKLRLFACACCRMLPYSSKDDRFQQALGASERYADGQTTKAALKRARQGVRAARFALPANDPKVHGKWSVYWLAEVAASENASSGVASEMQRLADQGLLELPPCIRASICTLARDLIGNPFQSIAPNKKWLKPKVVALAQEIYDSRAFDRLPTLAEALEEAGCQETDILAHCRAPGPHVLGCWAVDLLLGKT